MSPFGRKGMMALPSSLFCVGNGILREVAVCLGRIDNSQRRDVDLPLDDMVGILDDDSRIALPEFSWRCLHDRTSVERKMKEAAIRSAYPQNGAFRTDDDAMCLIHFRSVTPKTKVGPMRTGHPDRSSMTMAISDDDEYIFLVNQRRRNPLGRRAMNGALDSPRIHPAPSPHPCVVCGSGNVDGRHSEAGGLAFSASTFLRAASCAARLRFSCRSLL